jgi:predicted small metal-binding protein
MNLEATMPAKKVICDCGTIIREASDDALVNAVQTHAREVHQMTLSRDEVLSMAEPTQNPQ